MEQGLKIWGYEVTEWNIVTAKLPAFHSKKKINSDNLIPLWTIIVPSSMIFSPVHQ